MARQKPAVPGLDARAADAFVRTRVLALRSHGRVGGERVAVVGFADVEGGVRPVPDRCWWQPSPSDAAADRGLRVDVAQLLLSEAGEGPLLATWSRGGPHDVHESDVAWRAALVQAAAAVGVAVPPLVVITRAGWRCLPVGGERTWKRLRERGPVANPGPPAGTTRVRPRTDR